MQGQGRDDELLADRSRLVAQAMGVGFWQSDADGTALHWDEQMYRLHGRDPALPPLSQEEWLGSCVLPEARAAARSRLHADTARWDSETVLTLPVRAPDGSVRWIRTWTRRLEQGGRRRLMGMHQDVTEQRRLKALQAEAERAERASREKSAFMSSMSHHLRTPLNAVLGFSQLLLQDEREPLSARQRDWLTRIDRAGQELLEMVDEVFELAALEPSGAGAVPGSGSLTFDVVVKRLCDAVRPLARQRHVGLSLRTPPPVLHLSTDQGLLGQALQHLLAHSVRRSERGGRIEMACGAADGMAWLDIRDSGPRLDARQRELWFEPAPIQPPVADDEPMGLDLVRQALQRLGVQLGWHDDDAHGRAVLRVRMPLAERRTAPEADAAPGLSLLCIEDNPVNMLLVRELVAKRPGIGFRGADDGRSGLAMARQAPPDVVLLDLNLPDMNGREVLAALRADVRTAGCRVIALSAGALPEDIRSAREQGFDDYWTKPIDFERFLAGLDDLAARRRR